MALTFPPKTHLVCFSCGQNFSSSLLAKGGFGVTVFSFSLAAKVGPWVSSRGLFVRTFCGVSTFFRVSWSYFVGARISHLRAFLCLFVKFWLYHSWLILELEIYRGRKAVSVNFTVHFVFFFLLLLMVFKKNLTWNFGKIVTRITAELFSFRIIFSFRRFSKLF